MIRETELNLFVPSPELLVRLASEDRPLGIRAGPPHITMIRETYFDTPDQVLRRRGMTCKLRQEEGEDPDIVVTLGEGPDQEGITSRTRLTASAVGFGVFETLRSDSEPAAQIQKVVDPSGLRPQIALDIQRLRRVHRSGIFRRPVLALNFDRITVQVGAISTVFHEIRVRRRRAGGPKIRDIGLRLRDEHHLFPDGLSTLQRSHRVLAAEKKGAESELSPYALSLVITPFSRGRLGLQRRGSVLRVPGFRGSGEDAARALTADLGMRGDVELKRLGTTEHRPGRPVVELWSVPEPAFVGDEEGPDAKLIWYPWYELVSRAGEEHLSDPDLLSALLLLTRRKLLGQVDWVPPYRECSGNGQPVPGPEPSGSDVPPASSAPPPELASLQEFRSRLERMEDQDQKLEVRLEALTELTRGLNRFFTRDVARLKGQVLPGEESPEGERPEAGPPPTRILDLITVQVRGMADRMAQVLQDDLLPRLEARDIHLRGWSGLMHEDRRTLLEEFSRRYLPNLEVGDEWGPNLIPDMPSSGCGVGVATWDPDTGQTRFFHVVLAPDTPSLLPVPGSTMVVPMEEIVRGFVYRRHPELEEMESFLFRFLTGEIVVREPVPPEETGPEGELDEEDDQQEGEGVAEEEAKEGGESPRESGAADRPGADGSDLEGEGIGRAEDAGEEEGARQGGRAGEGEGESRGAGEPGKGGLAGKGGVAGEEGAAPGEAPVEAAPVYRERRESVVVRVLVERSMPERQQAQLIRALERHVAWKRPLVGWSDLYPLPRPLDVTDLQELLKT